MSDSVELTYLELRLLYHRVIYRVAYSLRVTVAIYAHGRCLVHWQTLKEGGW